MGLGATWQQDRDTNGNPVLVRVAADGLPLEGVDQNGQALTREQLINFGGTGAGGKFKPDVSTQDVEKGDLKGRVVTETRNGKTNTFVESGGKRFAYDSSWKPVSIGVAGAKAEATKAVELRYAGPLSYTKAGADQAGQDSVKYGINIGYRKEVPGEPLLDLNTGKPIVRNANGTITATTRTGGTVTTGAPAGGPVGGTAQFATQAAVSEASQRVFAEKRIPEIIEEGSQGGEVARIRREQLDTIRDNPSILGIYQGRGDNYDRARNVITNVISGAYGEENTGKLRDDLKAISISPAEKAALENFANLNMQINTKTLKANTGGGQISGAEQKINKETNLSDIASQTPLASMQGLHRSMFVGDLNSAKASFLANNPNFNTDAAFASAWSKKKSEATRGYEGIMRERAEFLKPYAPPRDASPAQIAAFNERVFKAFEMYPAPRWDSENNRWNYQTKNAELAAARALGKR
jgi:hypothetical protein